MKSHFKRRIASGVGVLPAFTLAGLIAAPLLAHHQWQDFAWAPSGNDPLPIAVVDNTDSRWNTHVSRAVSDWNQSQHLGSTLEYGSNSACAMVTGTIQVCNDDYGDTGWLGVATISLRDGTIVAGSTKLNDNYFERDQYNTYSWRQLVTCQEIGHDYGLGHQNEDFNTDATKSCMEYTRYPEGNEGPDAHDYEELARIYGGGSSDGGGKVSKGRGGGNGGGGGGGKGRNKRGAEPRVALPAVGNTPSEWGRPTAFLPNGRPYRFVRGRGAYTYVTHVTWAPDHEGGGHDH